MILLDLILVGLILVGLILLGLISLYCIESFYSVRSLDTHSFRQSSCAPVLLCTNAMPRAIALHQTPSDLIALDATVESAAETLLLD